VTATVQVPVPLHPPPLQPANVESAAGVAVNVIIEPVPYIAEQVAPQLMPAGVDVTVPLPAPALTTDSGYALIVNVAVTVAAAVIVTVHAPVPLQPPPLHPANVDPAAGDAVSVTLVPWL
jgi:hypothetical protein